MATPSAGRDLLSGTLYVVATPIGNLDDLTYRAVATLKAAARVLAEDTRRTRGLLSHLGIEGKPLDRLDAHATERAIEAAVERLQAGEDLALVTDAGTPMVSDPGSMLVRAAGREGLRVVPIPGASAVLAALAGSGLVEGAFRFLGFLPRGGTERDDAIATVTATPEAVVLFESPHRLTDTLADLARVTPDRQAVIARELTKLHEELLRGTLSELAAIKREWLGEIALVLGPHSPPSATEGGSCDEQIDRWIDDELARGARAKEAAAIVAARSGLPKREIYARVLTRTGGRSLAGEQSEGSASEEQDHEQRAEQERELGARSFRRCDEGLGRRGASELRRGLLRNGLRGLDRSEAQRHVQRLGGRSGVTLSGDRLEELGHLATEDLRGLLCLRGGAGRVAFVHRGAAC